MLVPALILREILESSNDSVPSFRAELLKVGGEETLE